MRADIQTTDRSCQHRTAYLVLVFILECALWMRGFWPRDSDPVQIAATLPIAVFLTLFSYIEFAALLAAAWEFVVGAVKRFIRSQTIWRKW